MSYHAVPGGMPWRVLNHRGTMRKENRHRVACVKITKSILAGPYRLFA